MTELEPVSPEENYNVVQSTPYLTIHSIYMLSLRNHPFLIKQCKLGKVESRLSI